MSVGILIITHDGIGASLFGTARFMLKECALPVKIMSTSHDSDIDKLKDTVSILIRELDAGDGVLVLTDLIGATPTNIILEFKDELNISVVTGLNLSMLIRVLNYPDLNLQEISEKAYSGGVDGIKKET
ncbi:MAG: PTS fructose transporter subunit IIA [Pseudomonadota bacterium]